MPRWHDLEPLFSYGTLQSESVQLATFGRTLAGEPDALPGHRLTMVEIENPEFVALSGSKVHRNVEPTGSDADFVSGTRLEVTREELEQADLYEQGAGYERARVTLQSGTRAWVYLRA